MEMDSCRLCTSKNRSLLYIFEVNGVQSNLVVDVISDVLQFDVCMTDKHPPFVCRQCYSKLMEFKLFKDQCKVSKAFYDNKLMECESTEQSQRDPLSDYGPIQLKEELGIFSTNIVDQNVGVYGPREEPVAQSLGLCSNKGDKLSGTSPEATGNITVFIESTIVEPENLSKTSNLTEEYLEERDRGYSEITISPVKLEEDEVPIHDNDKVDHMRLRPRTLRGYRLGESSSEDSSNDGSNIEKYCAEKSNVEGTKPEEHRPKDLRLYEPTTEESKPKESGPEEYRPEEARSEVPKPEDSMLKEMVLDELGIESLRKVSKDRRQLGVDEGECPAKKVLSEAEEEGNGRNTYLCHECEKEFNTYSSILLHLRGTHCEKKPFQCNLCGKMFKLKHHVRQHARFHKQERLHGCKVCDKSFLFRHHLQQHQTVHSRRRRPHQCTHCQRGFDRKGDLEKHEALHDGRKTWDCAMCKESFGGWKELLEHRKSHVWTRRFKCDLCGKMKVTKGELRKHIYLHTKPYDCGNCGASFGRLSTLKMHIRTHTGEKPYQCLLCRNRFTQKSGLMAHMLIHNGEKPHACNLCSWRCKRVADLKRHLETHSKDMKYECDSCGKRFNVRRNLVSHRTFHRREEEK